MLNERVHTHINNIIHDWFRENPTLRSWRNRVRHHVDIHNLITIRFKLEGNEPDRVYTQKIEKSWQINNEELYVNIRTWVVPLIETEANYRPDIWLILNIIDT